MMYRPSGAALPGGLYPMARAMGYRSFAAPRLLCQSSADRVLEFGHFNSPGTTARVAPKRSCEDVES